MEMREKLKKDEIAQDVARLVAPAIVDAIVSSTRTCLTCDHFVEHKGEICKLYSRRPPARVIAFGCPAYENEIPF